MSAEPDPLPETGGDLLSDHDAGPLQDLFVGIYRKNAWADPQSVSGPGSSVERTSVFRDEIARLVRDLRADSLLDAPCGDFNWMRMLDFGEIGYVGVDIVPELIATNKQRYGDRQRQFLCLDITRSRLPRADVILSRDFFVHLSFADCMAAIANFRRSGATHLIATTFVARTNNEDINTGGWRPLNLERAPFNFRPPLMLIDERRTEDDGHYRDKHLGLWRLEQPSA